ncbi:hypothetical protein HZS_6975 [Henneguya salminicola]|nr:hypothetical protein HZS_6975 [Henneguya salminicola]
MINFVGKNLGLKIVHTEYVLHSDDDFLFTKDTDLAKMLSVLLSTDASMVAADLNKCGFVGSYVVHHNSQKEKILLHVIGRVYEEIDGFEDCYRVDIPINLFMARKKDALNAGTWNEELVFSDHGDYFVRQQLSQNKVVVCTDITFIHNDKNDELRINRNEKSHLYHKLFYTSWNFTDFKYYDE